MTEYWPKPNSSMGAAVLVADKAILISQSPLRLTHFLPWSFAGETSLVLPTTPVDSLLHNWPIEPSHYLRCGHYCCQWQLHSCQPPLHSFWSQLLPMATPFLSATSPLSGQLMAAPLSTSPVSCPIISSVDPNWQQPLLRHCWCFPAMATKPIWRSLARSFLPGPITIFMPVAVRPISAWPDSSPMPTSCTRLVCLVASAARLHPWVTHSPTNPSNLDWPAHVDSV